MHTYFCCETASCRYIFHLLNNLCVIYVHNTLLILYHLYIISCNITVLVLLISVFVVPALGMVQYRDPFFHLFVSMSVHEHKILRPP